MIEVRKAEYVGDYRLQLCFNNGKEGIANLEETIFTDPRTVFAKLKDQTTFRTFTVAHGSVVWSDDLDLASEYLFYLAFKNLPDGQEQFRAWGYVDKDSKEQIVHCANRANGEVAT